MPDPARPDLTNLPDHTEDFGSRLVYLKIAESFIKSVSAIFHFYKILAL